MTEYSINKKTRNTLNMVTLIISIFICLAIQIVLNKTLFNKYGENPLILYWSLFIVPSVFFVMELMKLLFAKYLWKIKWINKIIGIPDLNGEWEVFGKSNYNNGTEFGGKICITQTLTKIKIAGFFGESKSFNTHTYLKVDEDGTFELSYCYENTPLPDASETMKKHCGFMIFNGDNQNKLEGSYFNDRFREKNGTITLIKQDKNNCEQIEKEEQK